MPVFGVLCKTSKLGYWILLCLFCQEILDIDSCGIFLGKVIFLCTAPKSYKLTSKVLSPPHYDSAENIVQVVKIIELNNKGFGDCHYKPFCSIRVKLV